MKSRSLFTWIAAVMFAAWCGSGVARAGGTVTITQDVECNGKKVGEIKLTLSTIFENNRAGVKARGGFRLTSAKVADEECWCSEYAWLQTIQIGGTDAPDAPTEGDTDYTDPNPGWEYHWGGGQTEGDFAPFLYNLDESRCSNDRMANRNLKTHYFDDRPGRHKSVADDGPFSWEATLSLVCLPAGTPSGETMDSSGSFKILACVKYGFTITKSGNSYSLAAIGPEGLDAVPASVQGALDDFNGRTGVGTWTIVDECETCPTPGTPPATLPDPDLDKVTTPEGDINFEYNALEETMTLSPSTVHTLHAGGDTGPTSPVYASDPLLGMTVSGGSFHLVKLDTGVAHFRSDTNRFSIILDDPEDDPDSAEHEQGIFTNGNPNGWETPLDSPATLLVYDPSVGPTSMFLPLQDVVFDSTVTGFAANLATAAATGRRLGYYFTPDTDLGAATNGFTTSATVSGTATLAFRRAAWVNLGFALGGTHGEPVLTADSTLIAGDPIAITLTNAFENTTAFLCVGLQAILLPLEGGTLVPDIFSPPGNFLALPTGPVGAIPIFNTWPVGVPPDIELYLQYWVVDPGGPFGFSVSNAVRGATP